VRSDPSQGRAADDLPGILKGERSDPAVENMRQEAIAAYRAHREARSRLAEATTAAQEARIRYLSLEAAYLKAVDKAQAAGAFEYMEDHGQPVPRGGRPYSSRRVGYRSSRAQKRR
jgi:hypothetical protein